MSSLATAAGSLAYYQILNEERDLRGEKFCFYFVNGSVLVVQFNFWCSSDNLICYQGAFERFIAGPELLLS